MRIGAIDIGTNTVRLLVADLEASGPPAPVWRGALVTRLGEGVDARHRLGTEAVGRTLRALRDLRERAADLGVDAVGAVATSAVRDAADREAFLDEAARALGSRPRLIGGGEEARLSFRGVRLGLRPIVAPLLVIDPGGGSTEFVFGDEAPGYATSVDIGSVRLTERRLPRRPSPGADLDAARAEVDGLLADVRLPDRPGTVAGVGGTFTSLAALLLGLESYDSGRVHGAVFDAAAFAGMTRRLAGLTVAETAALPSLDPGRAPVLLGGAVVAERALAHVGAAAVVVSEADILDGVVLDLGGR